MAKIVSSVLMNIAISITDENGDKSEGYNPQESIKKLLIAMRNQPAYQLSLPSSLSQIHEPFLNEYISLLFKNPPLFQEVGEVEKYYKHIQRWVDELHTNILVNLMLKCGERWL